MAQNANVAVWFGKGGFNGGRKGRTRGFWDRGATAAERDGKHIIFKPFGPHTGKTVGLRERWQRDEGSAKRQKDGPLHAGSRISAARSFSISAAALASGQAKVREVSVMVGWAMIQAAGSTSCAVIAKTPISVRSP